MEQVEQVEQVEQWSGGAVVRGVRWSGAAVVRRRRGAERLCSLTGPGERAERS
ncbi:hypothetical protein [Streptomyces avermitilis]|uniref:hypothetical protein n=1 Tax=Streptomyces avermitilis TaxID=33903 RepID=UPI0037204B85